MVDRPERQIERVRQGAGADSHHDPRRGHAAPANYALAGDPATPAASPAPRLAPARPPRPFPSYPRTRHGLVHDGQPRLGRPEVPSEHSLSKLVRLRAADRPRHRPSKSTAGSTPKPPRLVRCGGRHGVRRRVPPCSAHRTPPQTSRPSRPPSSVKPHERVVRPAVCEPNSRSNENRSPRGLHPSLSLTTTHPFGQRSSAARGKELQRHQRGGGRTPARWKETSRAASPNSCCWTCSSPTSTASTSRPASPGRPDSPAVILVSSRDSSDLLRPARAAAQALRGVRRRRSFRSERVQELLV